jgi:FkbM family methyltransferase
MSVLVALLRELNIVPVLVDVGASGGGPEIWREIAPASIYLGFDPDLREIRTIADGEYEKATIVNSAVCEDKSASQTRFYLTRSPYCSSTLRPDTEALRDYIFHDLFDVLDEVNVRATTIERALREQQYDGLDWIKIDAQGADLRIFESIPDHVRDRIVAVDTEPGLLDAYRGEDLFVEVHRHLCSQGFWLSRIDVRGTKRVRKETIEFLQREKPDLVAALNSERQRISPGWCEGRYLRTIGWLEANGAPLRQFVLLWVFAVVDRQFGYAIDVSRHIESKPLNAELGAHLTDLAAALLTGGSAGIDSIISRTRSVLQRAGDALRKRLG